MRPRWSPALAVAFAPDRPREWDPFLTSLPGAREFSALWAAPDDEPVAESA